MRNKERTKLNNLTVGLAKMNEANQTVDHLKVKLAELQPSLQQKKGEQEELSVVLE